VTVVGPVKVTVGAEPLLWHEVQVEPLFPENPEIPLLLAVAGMGDTRERRVTSPIHDIPMIGNRRCRFRLMVLGDDGTDRTTSRTGRKFLSSTVASFLRLRHGA